MTSIVRKSIAPPEKNIETGSNRLLNWGYLPECNVHL